MLIKIPGLNPHRVLVALFSYCVHTAKNNNRHYSNIALDMDGAADSFAAAQEHGGKVFINKVYHKYIRVIFDLENEEIDVESYQGSIPAYRVIEKLYNAYTRMLIKNMLAKVLDDTYESIIIPSQRKTIVKSHLRASAKEWTPPQLKL